MSEVSTRPARKRRFTVDSLFVDTTPRAVGVTDLVNAKEIRLDRIVPDPEQPRRTIDDERLEELAASIRIEGVLQPIIVRYEAEPDHYVVVHGERRWRAARLAGLEVIPAIVRDVPEERRLLQQLMENVVREDLNAVDRAAALRTLKARMGDVPWERVAEAVGIRRSRLFQLLGTEKLPPTVQDDLRAGRLSEKQSRVLQGLPEPVQEALARLIVDDGLSHGAAQRLARTVREDEELIGLEAEPAHERLRAMRAALDAGNRPVRRRKQSDLGTLLRRVVPEADVAALLAADPPSAAQFDASITYLARLLAGAAGAPRDAREIDGLAPRLRALQELISAVLARADDASG